MVIKLSPNQLASLSISVPPKIRYFLGWVVFPCAQCECAIALSIVSVNPHHHNTNYGCWSFFGPSPPSSPFS